MVDQLKTGLLYRCSGTSFGVESAVLADLTAGGWNEIQGLTVGGATFQAVRPFTFVGRWAGADNTPVPLDIVAWTGRITRVLTAEQLSAPPREAPPSGKDQPPRTQPSTPPSNGGNTGAIIVGVVGLGLAGAVAYYLMKHQQQGLSHG